MLFASIVPPWTTTLLPLSERRPCKEALLTISVLLPKLRAVRRAQRIPRRSAVAKVFEL